MCALFNAIKFQFDCLKYNKTVPTKKFDQKKIQR